MLIDCDGCPVRQIQCDDCVVTAMLAMPAPDRDDDRWDHQDLLPEQQLDLDWRERAALTRLVRAGLISPQVAASATARRESLPLRSATG